MIKFPVMGGTLTLRSSKIIPIECATVSGPEDQPLPVNKVEEERIKVAINPEHTEQTVMIGSNLTEKARAKLSSKEAVSAVLMTEREAKQMPIYFVSRALRGPEVNYTSMEKLVLALVHASKRLRRYFQAHPIVLGEFGIHYRPRISVKGQVLADFIVERLEEEDLDASAKEEESLSA
ncbi:reverse transcriptase domain-containing protein [Tanacetum coccineum]